MHEAPATSRPPPGPASPDAPLDRSKIRAFARAFYREAPADGRARGR